METSFLIDWATSFIGNYGLYGILALMTLESFFIPFPSEITMGFAGFLAGRGVFEFWEAVGVGTAGNILGSVLAYFVGYTKGEAWIRSFIKSFGKLVFIKEQDFIKAKKWFEKYDQDMLLPARMLPVIRAFISMPAGVSKMNFFLFLTLTSTGTFVWTWFLTFLGLKLGQNWLLIEPNFKRFQYLILAAFTLIVGFFFVRKFKRFNLK